MMTADSQHKNSTLLQGFLLHKPSPDQGFPRTARLLNRSDYQRVFNDAVKSSDHCFTVLAKSEQSAPARLGLAISKKVLNKAVQRNRIKRLVRESFRQHQAHLGGLEIVVMARRGVEKRGNAELYRSLEKHWQRLVEKCDAS